MCSTPSTPTPGETTRAEPVTPVRARASDSGSAGQGEKSARTASSSSLFQHKEHNTLQKVVEDWEYINAVRVLSVCVCVRVPVCACACIWHMVQPLSQDNLVSLLHFESTI